MLNLRERLQRMVPKPSSSPSHKQGNTQREELKLGTEFTSAKFQLFQGEDGSFVGRSYLYPLNTQHGKMQLAQAYDIDLQQIATIYPFLPKVVDEKKPWLQQLLFFDTETTGLSQGSGTLIFLLGFGYFTAEGFRFEQWFLPHWEGEHAFLTAFVERLQAFPVVTSFNGKAFDWNLLQTRLLYQRIRLTEQPRQLDLLYMARRLWRKELDNCSLAQIEEDKLGVIRHDDVPGREVPERYFKFVNEGDSTGLFPVFQHNEWDILSLVTLFHHLYTLLQMESNSHDEMGAGSYVLPTPYESVALGRIHEDRKKNQQAERYYTHSLTVDNAEDWLAHRLTLARFYKRNADWPNAVILWQECLDENRPFTLEPYVELAKYYEHQQKDYGSAFTYTWDGLSRLKQTLTTARTVRQEEELIKRLVRLEKKMGTHARK